MEDDSGSTTLSFKIIGHLSKILARNQAATKHELKELDKDLALLGQPDADALVEAGTLELLLRYLAVDQHFDVIARCLMALSAYDTARTGLYEMHQSGVAHLAKSMFNQARGAKGEKQIERASMLGKILVLYSIDAPEDQMTWLTSLCELLVESLDKASSRGGQQEAYVYLSLVLPAMWVSMGSSLAPILASRIIDAGGMPLLIKVAKEVQRSDIKGLPKIIAEKALNLLCACNAEQPELSLQQIDVEDLAQFCVQTTTKSDWVQSQELSLVLLGRLVFLQHVLAEDYLQTEPVVKMLQHALETKSPALRMTALCLSLICSESLFEAVCVEANKVIVELGQGTYQSIKRLSGTSSGGMTILRWGRDINKFAQDLLKGSQLLARMAETVPVHLPMQLVELLPLDLRTYVMGIKGVHGVKDTPPKRRAGMGRVQVDNGDGDEYEEEAPSAPAPAPARRPLAATNAGAANGAGAQRAGAAANGAAPVRVVSNVKQVIQAQAAGSTDGNKRPRSSGQFAADSDDVDNGEDPAKRPKVAANSKQSAVHHHMLSMMADAQGTGPQQTAQQQQQQQPQQPQRPPQPAAAPAPRPMVDKVRPQGDASVVVHNNNVHVAAAKPTISAQLKASQASAPGKQALPAQQQQQQQAVPLRGSAGGAMAASGASTGTNDVPKGFTSSDLSHLNTYLFELMMNADQLEDKPRQVLEQLMKSMEKVGKLLPLKHRLPMAAAADCESSLRQWASRIRQMGNSLSHAKGPALEMLITFSNMMFEEVAAYLDDAERQAMAMA